MSCRTPLQATVDLINGKIEKLLTFKVAIINKFLGNPIKPMHSLNKILIELFKDKFSIFLTN